MPSRRRIVTAMAVAAGAIGRRGPAWAVDGADPPFVLDAVQRPPAGDAGPLPPSLLVRPDGSAIATWEDWLVERRRLRAAWLEFLGPWRVDASPDSHRVEAEHRGDGCRRRRIFYRTEPDEEVEAWLLEPDDGQAAPAAGRPAAVVFHSTTDRTIDEPAGIGDDAAAIGAWLCRRGFVVLCPRCHLWNTSAEHRLDTAGAVTRLAARHPGALGMRKLLHDGSRAVDILASLDGVDSRRIVAAGHSLGAKETLYLAAFDDRVVGAAFSEGGIGLSFSNWHDPWYLGAAIREPGFALDHSQLLALSLPGGMLVLGGESGPGAADGDRSWGAVARALEVGRLRCGVPRVGLLNHRGGHALPDGARRALVGWLVDSAERAAEGALSGSEATPTGANRGGRRRPDELRGGRMGLA